MFDTQRFRIIEGILSLQSSMNVSIWYFYSTDLKGTYFVIDYNGIMRYFIVFDNFMVTTQFDDYRGYAPIKLMDEEDIISYVKESMEVMFSNI